MAGDISRTLERLALADALAKRLKELTDTHGGKHGADTLRTEADGALRELYERTGADRMRISIGGQEVGTLSARVSKPRHEVRPRVVDREEFRAWCLLNSDSVIDELVSQGSEELLAAATDGGVVPDGVRYEDVDVPPTWLGTTLKVDPEKVAKAYGPRLDSAATRLLEGGEE